MRGRHTAAAAALAVLLAPALAWAEPEGKAEGKAEAQDDHAEAEAEPPAWITTKNGAPFRVRFDPSHRLFVGAFADLRTRDGGGMPAPGLELGLFLRSTPDTDWEVFWKSQHEIAHLAFRSASGGAPGITVDGRLYRGTFIRQSRNGSLTIPTTPPIRFPVPFDIGVLIELGRLDGVAWPEPGGRGLVAGVVRGDVLADFWRSRRPGRWLAVGVGARYDLGLERDPAGALREDHRIAPMTALTIAAHTRTRDGLFAGFVDADGAYRWSSVRGWEPSLRAEAEAEITWLAINDRPLSMFVHTSAETGGDTTRPDLRALLGIRFAAPLRSR